MSTERVVEGSCEMSERCDLRSESLVSISDHLPLKETVLGIEVSMELMSWVFVAEMTSDSFSDSFIAGDERCDEGGWRVKWTRNFML